ncbi:MAG: ferritin family protein [Deltaproteobacteria bacterium]|nr:ferritin family protein [Deltaproteobacteria bacterium]
MGTTTLKVDLALPDVLELAVSMERTAEGFYSGAAAKMADPALRRLLEEMAATEHAHADTWQRERDSLSNGAAIAGTDQDGVVTAYLATWLHAPLAKAREALPRLDASATSRDILSAALRMETEAIAFYSALEDFVRDEATRQHVRRVLADERRHATDIMASVHEHKTEW